MGSAVLTWMRNRPHSGAWGVLCGVVVALGLFVACKPKTQGTTSPPEAGPTQAHADPAVEADDPAEPGEPIADGPASRDPECTAEGEPWDGNPKSCTYEHEGCCYPDPASLCAAAGCNDNDCTIVESRPAQARC